MADDAPMNGTELARAHGVETSPFRVIRAANLRALANEWVRLRPFRMLPSHLLTLTMLLLAGFPRERVAIVGGFYALNAAHLIAHSLRARRTGIHERTIFHSHLLLLTLQSCVVAATGAMHSPLWPALLGASLAAALGAFSHERSKVELPARDRFPALLRLLGRLREAQLQGIGLSVGELAGRLPNVPEATVAELLALLEREELTVAELSAVLRLAQPRVSTHLAKLKEADLVRDRRAGVSAYYRRNGELPEREEAGRVFEAVSDGRLIRRDLGFAPAYPRLADAKSVM